MSADLALLSGVGLLAIGLVLLALGSLFFAWTIGVREWLLSSSTPKHRVNRSPVRTTAQAPRTAAESTQPMEQVA